MTLLLTDARIITMDAENHILRGDVRLAEDRITELGTSLAPRGDEVVRASGMILIPGLVQAHIHLCQTLFRNQAEGLVLLDWLRQRIWPLEAALEAESLRASARLGIAELLLGGTTTILDMGTVRHTDVLFEEALRLGLRYIGGKTIMDEGQGYPQTLRESHDEAIAESVRLCTSWHGKANGRLRYAFSPRFVLSCTAETMRSCVREARARGALLHTHSSENPEEVELVRKTTGMGNVEYLHSLGFTGADVILAHGVWLSAKEVAILRDTRTRIVHCPSSNLKLGSGIAHIPELIEQNVPLALGADGAACSNVLDGFMEMRLAGLLHKARGGPCAVSAEQAMRLATSWGAHALGLSDCGAIQPGNKADLVLLDPYRPHLFPEEGDAQARVVFCARASDVHSVWIDGVRVVNEGVLTQASSSRILEDANVAARAVRQRALVS